jgi:dihydropteroate synthase
MRIGNREFDVRNNTYVMGIMNLTPDSFSDGGQYNQVEQSFKHAERLIVEGADILDIGGESTRPGHVQISPEEEIERIAPAIEGIKKRFDIPLSVDTYKSSVAKVALELGVDMVNDIWGLKYDDEIAGVVADYKVPICLMHNRKEPDYINLIPDTIADLKESIKLAKGAGISDDKIIVDPGVGFAKSYEENLEVIRNLSEYQTLGYPVLLGTSRKSVIGLTLDLPLEEREEGTIVTTVMAVLAGCAFVRVHNVKSNVRAIKMVEAIRDVKI